MKIRNILLTLSLSPLLLFAVDWDYNPNDFMNNMTVTANIYDSDGNDIGSPDIELVAFAGEKCRGAAKAMLVGNKYVYYLMVYGAEGDEIVLKAYSTTQSKFILTTLPATFDTNRIIGLSTPTTVTNNESFEITRHIVTFDTQDGSAVTKVSVEHNSPITEPTAPQKEGYTFKGWYKEPIGTNIWNFDLDKITVPTTLYAKWEINKYTVTLPTVTGATVSAEEGSQSPVQYDGSFSFKVLLEKEYNQSKPTVKTNGITLTPHNNIYTITNVKTDQVITVEDVVLNPTSRISSPEEEPAVSWGITGAIVIKGSGSSEKFQILTSQGIVYTGGITTGMLTEIKVPSGIYFVQMRKSTVKVLVKE